MSDLIDREELKKKKVYSNERREYVVPVAEIDWIKPIVVAENATGDMISRQTAINAMYALCEAYSSKEYNNENPHIDLIVDTLNDIPSAEQRTGRWIYEEMGGKDGFRCSECGFFVPWDYEFFPNTNYIKNYNVCPHCLARMKGEES